MLKTLYIRNYALIEEVTISFSGGLNIITGETGAGKSILIGALGLILGERASADQIRQGSEKAIIEGLFTVSDKDQVRQILMANGYEAGPELIIRREVTNRGASRAFINDSPASLTLLRDVGDHLIDLHGQHDHQMLLRPETHIRLLDNVGGLERLVSEYTEHYQRMAGTQRELEELRQREQQLREKQEFYQFQLQEINAVGPKPDEDTTLGQEIRVLENSEKISTTINQLYSLLYEDENSVRDQLIRARNLLDHLAGIDAGFDEYRQECMSASVIVEEITKYIQSYSALTQYSPSALEQMRERLFRLSGLRKRFGGSVQAVLEYKQMIEREVELATNFESQILKLEESLRLQRIQTGELAVKLSQKRAEVSRKIERSVQNTLKHLGIEKARFVVQITQEPVQHTDTGTVIVGNRCFRAGASGYDTVEFYISTNLGEDVKPIARVASGGEVSRVMLALKTVLAKNDKLPILVFDEIDTGISGRISSKVGIIMKDLADFHQIITITHLPQIAALGSSHFVVEKAERNQRTATQVRRLTGDEHAYEVARLMSGETVTESSLKMARELINV